MITVVSGLPRSGTSMMMQMLEAGGMDVMYSKGYRGKDVHNPNGYYEMVPDLFFGRGRMMWLECDGGAIKLVANQIKLIPMVNGVYIDYPHGKMDVKVIFMRRNMRSITDSAERMIHASKADLDYLFSKTLAELLKYLNQNKINYLQVWYEDVLKDPEEEASRVTEFLGEGLDITAMAKAVKR